MPAVAVECLEERRLYSVAYFVNSGVLTVYGGSGGDSLNLHTTFSGSSSIRIVEGSTTFVTVSSITSIILRGYGGGDTLDISDVDNASINCLVYGGDGIDAITGSSGNDYLWGGADGDDISGGNGNDYIVGEAGDDELYGDAGNDIIYGGDGNDRITLFTGTDQAYGGYGDDIFISVADDEIDYIDGGDGNDDLDADSDPGDNIYHVES